MTSPRTVDTRTLLGRINILYFNRSSFLKLILKLFKIDLSRRKISSRPFDNQSFCGICQYSSKSILLLSSAPSPGLLKDHRKEFEKYVLSHKILPGKVTFMEAVAHQQNNNNTEEVNSNQTSTPQSHSDLRNRVTTISSTTTEQLYERPPVPSTTSNIIPNGYSRAIRVYYISEENGKPEIAELCRKFSESIKGGTLSIDQINIEFVDSQLREEFNQMPDPDLALYTGEFCCTYGFLPWHIRLTEFIPIGQNLVMQDFLAVLYKYAKKEQRYGK